MKAKFVHENMRFERGFKSDSREDILDRVLNRKITIELDAANVTVDKHGKVSRGQNFPDNDYFLDVIENSGAEWEQLTSNYGVGGYTFEFSGTKKQLLPIIGMWDAHSREQDELEAALKDWDGNENDLWEIIG